MYIHTRIRSLIYVRTFTLSGFSYIQSVFIKNHEKYGRT